MVRSWTDIGVDGNIVLPKRMRDALDLREGDRLLFEELSKDELRVKVLRGEDKFLRLIRNPGKGRALDPDKLKDELWG